MKLWRGQPDSWNWKPSDKDKGRLWLGFSAVALALAANAYLCPSSPPFTGRWGWLHQLFFDAFGTSGDLVMYCLSGAATLAVGISYLSRRAQ